LGQRDVRFLASALIDRRDDALPRAPIPRGIADGAVTSRGRALGASERLEVGEEIEVVPRAPPLSSAIAEEGIAFDVLYVDDDLVVVNKPAGLVVHPSRGHAGGTLVNGLLARGLFRPDYAIALADPRDKEGHLRPGIVHRLDAGTSGVMVVARTPAAREKLKAQFQAHTIERAYEAITVGKAKAVTHATLHGRHPTERLRFTTRVREGKRAVTHVEVLAAFGERATHVRCRLETGRTHQIRVHLADAGTPILGDALYGPPPRDVPVRRIGEAIGHQALVARVLGFVHPRTGRAMRFEVDRPEDFVRALQALVALTGLGGASSEPITPSGGSSSPRSAASARPKPASTRGRRPGGRGGGA
jgi:23S rRNA pseudouridine1911/1915/1917 synthase